MTFNLGACNVIVRYRRTRVCSGTCHVAYYALILMTIYHIVYHIQGALAFLQCDPSSETLSLER
jgi:hypothetical protein